MIRKINIKVVIGVSVLLVGSFIFYKYYNGKQVLKRQLKQLEEISDVEFKVKEYYKWRGYLHYAAQRKQITLLGGKVVEFDKKGNLKKIYYRNENGTVIGDISLFKHNMLGEHFFNLSKYKQLYHVQFDNNKVKSIEGRPYFVRMNKDEIEVGDTLKFYIATPLIPFYTTNVKFKCNRDSNSLIEYINDIRQFNYKYVPSDTGEYMFTLEVNIKREDEEIILSDSETFKTHVK